MVKVISVNYKKCTGCRICEIVCSVKFEGKVNPRRARIRVIPFFPGIDIPIVCTHCEPAPCINVCPSKAIKKDEKRGIVLIRKEDCTGCMECVKACPSKAIFLHPEEKVAIKCDLCGGDPECVKFCPTGALEFAPVPYYPSYRIIRARSAQEIAEELKESIIESR